MNLQGQAASFLPVNTPALTSKAQSPSGSLPAWASPPLSGLRASRIKFAHKRLVRVQALMPTVGVLRDYHGLGWRDGHPFFPVAPTMVADIEEAVQR